MPNFFFYIKYPSVAFIISTIWVGTAVLIAFDKTLPIFNMIFINMFASFLMSIIGFRVDKK